jgi:hypothetical protein
MKKTRILAFTLVILLLAGAATLFSCKDKEDENTLGSGKTSFTLKITDKEGEIKNYTVKTDEKTVGDALIKIGYIPAESKDAGYFETLNGVSGETDEDGNIWYWSFDVNGEVQMVGVFDVEVKEKDVYGFTYITMIID